MIRILLEKLLALLRAPCGAYGGPAPVQVVHGVATTARWCLKPLGHSDSCYYEVVPQPLWRFRRWAKGYPWPAPIQSSQETP